MHKLRSLCSKRFWLSENQLVNIPSCKILVKPTQNTLPTQLKLVCWYMSEAGTEQQVLNMFEAQSLFDMHVPPCQLSMMAAGQNRKDMSVYTFTWFDA